MTALLRSLHNSVPFSAVFPANLCLCRPASIRTLVELAGRKTRSGVRCQLSFGWTGAAISVSTSRPGWISLAVGPPRPRSHPGIGEDKVARVYNFKSFREICNAFTLIPSRLAGAVLCGRAAASAVRLVATLPPPWPHAAAAAHSARRSPTTGAAQSPASAPPPPPPAVWLSSCPWPRS